MRQQQQGEACWYRHGKHHQDSEHLQHLPHTLLSLLAAKEVARSVGGGI